MTIATRFYRAAGLGVLLTGCATAPVPSSSAVYVWPLPPESPRIRFVETLWRSDQFTPAGKSWLKDVVLGPEGEGAEGMAKPYAITVDPKGRVYVSDTGQSRVWVFDREAKRVRFLGESGPGALITPAGLAADGRGVVFVSDTKLDRVFGYDETGKVVLALGEQGEFGSPSGLAVDRKSGRLYVVDTGHHKVRVYDTVSGKFLFEFGRRGKESGEFNFPTHAYARKGRLYVTDTMNFRVQVFTLDGKYVKKYGELGASWGQFARPKGVGVDSEGNVYVADAAFGNFQIFNDEGELLLPVGQTGTSRPGQFLLPAGLHVDERDRIYVVDQYNRRVQVFEYLGAVELAKANQRESSR